MAESDDPSVLDGFINRLANLDPLPNRGVRHMRRVGDVQDLPPTAMFEGDKELKVALIYRPRLTAVHQHWPATGHVDLDFCSNGHIAVIPEVL